MGNFIMLLLTKFSCFKWLYKRANRDPKTLIFVEKLRKLPIFCPYRLRGCSALLDPFGFVTALA